MGPENPTERHTSDFRAESPVTFTKHKCEGIITQCHLSQFIEKTSFRQSLDKRVYVKMSLDKKGHVARPFRHFLGM